MLILFSCTSSCDQPDLEFHSTGFGAWMQDGMSAGKLENQAATYKAILEIMIELSMNSVVGWNTWHINDGSGWRQHLTASLFDTTYMAKPAYYAFQEALEGSPWN